MAAPAAKTGYKPVPPAMVHSASFAEWLVRRDGDRTADHHQHHPPQPVSDEEEAASREAAIRDLVDGEARVDLAKLRASALAGLPAQVRADVWMYLLGVKGSEKADDDAAARRLETEFADRVRRVDPDDALARRIKMDARRRVQREPAGAVPGAAGAMVDRYWHVVALFLADSDLDYCAEMVSLLEPFLSVFQHEWCVLACFRAFMERHRHMFNPQGLTRATGNFLAILRHALPEVVEHLESEEVDPSRWAHQWLQGLLVKQMSTENVLRLWDAYLAGDHGLDFHPYVCVALVEAVQEELLEADGVEVLTLLQQVPTRGLEISHLLAKAKNVRDDTLGQGIL